MIKLQTYVGERIAELTKAGQIIEIPPVDHRGLSRLRSATKQVATRVGIDVELRTIDGKLYARRVDFPMPPPAMPGMEVSVSSRDRVMSTLESMTPWPDDPNHDRIVEALNHALRMV